MEKNAPLAVRERSEGKGNASCNFTPAKQTLAVLEGGAKMNRRRHRAVAEPDRDLVLG